MSSELFAGEGKSIVATQGGGFNPKNDILRFIEFCEDSDIPYNSLITSIVTLDNINRGIDLVRSNYSGRVFIDTGMMGA
jgi:Zn-dependent alcohol dehydrogenase